MTRNEIRQLPFRFKYLGNYVSFKQRYTRELAERIWNDSALAPYKNDLVFFLNSERTHGIIAGNTAASFVQILMRAKNKHVGLMLINQGQNLVDANTYPGPVVTPQRDLMQWHTDPDGDELPF